MSTPNLPLPIDTRRVASLDKTVIQYHLTPAPRAGAPLVMLANGLGGPHVAWRQLIQYLGDRYQFVTWDYRGLYGSDRPDPDIAEGYRIERHADDLLAVLDALDAPSASLVGWSMGVQVVLEAVRRRRTVARNLVLLNGTAGRPFTHISSLPFVGSAAPRIIDLLRGVSSVASRVTRHASAQPEFLRVLKRARLIGRVMREDEFAELSHGFGQIDMDAFFRNLRALGDHDASSVLAKLDMPVLVITGDEDGFTPRGLAQQMARRIAHAELLVVRGGTHYTAVEYPELVNLRIERFYRDQGYN